MIVADTDALIDFLRNMGLADRVELELSQGKLATTSITAFELYTGIRSERQLRAVETLLASMQILPLDTKKASLAAKIQRNLREQGITMGMTDALIAGICLDERAILLTRNQKDFKDVPNLVLSNIS